VIIFNKRQKLKDVLVEKRSKKVKEKILGLCQNFALKIFF
jgi:hypothetical protein